jgi:D-xylose transport system ATP-binding protein
MVTGFSCFPTLELRGVSKRFGAVQALCDVDLEVFPGEVVGLVGENGAGKSTLIKCIAGIFPIDTGEIWFEGQVVHIRSPKDANRLGIQTVYQDLALCDNLDVVANLFLGRELTGTIPIDEEVMEKRAIEVLEGLSITLPNVRSEIKALSGGQRQSVAISRAVIWNSKLVILDEPTAALGYSQAQQVLELIRRLRKQGLAVILVNHNLEEIFQVVDRVSVLRLGRNNGVFSIKNTTREQVLKAITGADYGMETIMRTAARREDLG